MPSMWIVAGPNGAGKSIFTAAYLQENVLPAGILKLNADEVTARYREEDKATAQDELNLRAARAIDAEVTRCILQGQSFLLRRCCRPANTGRASDSRGGGVFVSTLRMFRCFRLNCHRRGWVNG